MLYISSKDFEEIILKSINNVKAPISVKKRIKNDVLIRIKSNGDRLKYVNAKVSNLDWTDSNRNFYIDIYNQIKTAEPCYEEILLTATSVGDLSINIPYTRREISILANNYNEQRGILVQKTTSNTKNVFAIIDPNNNKTKYHDYIEGETIYYYPLDTGRTFYPLNDVSNVAIKNILGNSDEAIYMFEKENKDMYWFLGRYYTRGLATDKNGNLIFVLKKYKSVRKKNEVAKSVLSFWKEEDKWMGKNKAMDSEDKNILVKARANQGFYRELLMKRFGNKCVLTDIRNPELLVASHIKPYSKCNNCEKIDENNGLLLNGLADKLFDRGLITFDCDGNIIYSSQIQESDLLKIQNHICKTKLESVYTESKKYFEYHHGCIFKK